MGLYREFFFILFIYCSLRTSQIIVYCSQLQQLVKRTWIQLITSKPLETAFLTGKIFVSIFVQTVGEENARVRSCINIKIIPYYKSSMLSIS